MGNSLTARAQEEKDLGVIIQNDLLPDEHTAKIEGETLKLLKNRY